MISTIYSTYLDSSGVCTDTRNIKEGSLFIALKGESFNGNDFILASLWPVISEQAKDTTTQLVKNWKTHGLINGMIASKNNKKKNINKLPFVYIFP